jgi:hypothetical protein
MCPRGTFIRITPGIKSEIEPFVRDWLRREFGGAKFGEGMVKLPAGGSYSFDAVSQDAGIVAAILYNRALKGTKRENTAGLKKAYAELEHLKALDRKITKVMVFTDFDFSNLVRRRASRFGVESLKLLVCPLPEEKQERLNQLLDTVVWD